MAKKKNKKKYQKLLNELLVLIEKKQKKNELNQIIEDTVKQPKFENCGDDDDVDDFEEEDKSIYINPLDIALFNGLDQEFITFLDAVLAHGFMITKENLLGIKINQVYRNCKKNETLFRCCAKVHNSEELVKFYSPNYYLDSDYIDKEDKIESRKIYDKDLAKTFEDKDIFIAILMSFNEDNKCIKITIMRDTCFFIKKNFNNKKYTFEYEK